MQRRKHLAHHAAMRARQVLQRQNHLMTASAQFARRKQHAIEMAHIGAELPGEQHATHDTLLRTQNLFDTITECSGLHDAAFDSTT
jgi:hypothetical protein